MHKKQDAFCAMYPYQFSTKNRKLIVLKQ